MLFRSGREHEGPSSAQIRPIFLLETHSELMVLRLQRLVESGELNRDAVSLLSVEPDEESGETTRVRRITLSDSGTFEQHWPSGFFAEREEELLR